MTLQQLLALHGQRAEQSVPDWLLGYFKRYSISFANGLTDLKTHVCWLQSRNFTIDLRLPLESAQPAAKQLSDYTLQELEQLANYEGWMAGSMWDGSMLRWSDNAISLQLHNRWTESATLKRIGNCLVEFCPSNVLVEDWRLQPSKPGPLIGLQLIAECELSTGFVRHQGGGLIVCGDYAALVLGRSKQAAQSLSFIPATDQPFKTLVVQAHGDTAALADLFNFETSVASGSLEQDFIVDLSTQPGRIGQPLFAMDGFEAPMAYQHDRLGNIQVVRQLLTIDGKLCERLFTIDTLESEIAYSQHTATTLEAQSWYQRESPTLTRYTEVVH